ncbi:hypothetical protein SAMN05443667_101381 [Flavobacterium gillisiae]|uniref:Uncharacterized protein n=1 Tax=Flavobacterium gillisiae TaxID=150146 RepID=A0A1H3X4S4_9FLAO|nr:hypothetical protein [Flavobacterium gillisiae]SDZ94405.1 hypothetical protein SAMN05443667_101381 [Flavobacterium gillisiae]
MANKKTSDKKSTSAFDSIKNFIENVTENVIEGTTVVTDKIKDSSAKAYVASAELAEEASQRIHLYTDKVSLQKEEKSIIERQKEITVDFGGKSLAHYIKTDTLHKPFLNTAEIATLVEEYKGNQKNLISIEKKIKKLNN